MDGKPPAPPRKLRSPGSGPFFGENGDIPFLPENTMIIPGTCAEQPLGFLRRLPQKSLLFRAIILGGVALLAAAVVLPFGWLISGNRMGLFAGAAAGGVCLLAAWTALFLSSPLRMPQYVLSLVLVGMMVRMGIPLAAALTVHFLGGPLANAGFLRYLVVFYPIMLAAEAFLSFPPYPSPTNGRGEFRNEKKVPSAEDFVG